MPIVQGVQGNEALNFAKKQAEDALRLQAGLQLQAHLLAQLAQARRAFHKGWDLAKTQALQFGAIKINCVGLGRRFHMACAPKQECCLTGWVTACLMQI